VRTCLKYRVSLESSSGCYDEHAPPHLHAEHQSHKATLDFHGNVLRGDLGSKTALRLVREWIDYRAAELQEDWELARARKELNKIAPLD
jgi:hypothetical protein